MTKIPKEVKILFFILLVIFFSAYRVAICEKPVKNVIIFIGDGMGYEHIKATRMYLGHVLSFETFDSKAKVTTYAIDKDDNKITTDSAAAATAIATGLKVDNEVISVGKDGKSRLTMLEYFKENGKATGLVTTAYMADATPAAFGAHALNRKDYRNIIIWYFKKNRINVLFGGGNKEAKNITGFIAKIAKKQGYKVIRNKTDLMSLDTESETMVSGQFSDTDFPYEYDIKDNKSNNIPHLSDMTQVAIDILDNNPDGFFLMVEGALIDHASENKDLSRMIYEIIEFNKAVRKTFDWAKNHTNTLIIITADHETGGLVVLENKGQGKLPAVSWQEGNGHTDIEVPVYIWGKEAAQAVDVKDNTNFFNLITKSK